jgi:hypothetical protein
LSELKTHGNISAREFVEHLELVVEAVATFESNGHTVQPAPVSNSLLLTPNINPLPQGSTMSSTTGPIGSLSDPITTEMALFGPLMQDFLTQDETELGLPFMLDNDAFLNGFDWSGTNLES